MTADIEAGDRVAAEIAKLPRVFMLRSFPGDYFRASPQASYGSPAGSCFRGNTGGRSGPPRGGAAGGFCMQDDQCLDGECRGNKCTQCPSAADGRCHPPGTCRASDYNSRYSR